MIILAALKFAYLQDDYNNKFILYKNETLKYNQYFEMGSDNIKSAEMYITEINIRDDYLEYSCSTSKKIFILYKNDKNFDYIYSLLEKDAGYLIEYYNNYFIDEDDYIACEIINAYPLPNHIRIEKLRKVVYLGPNAKELLFYNHPENMNFYIHTNADLNVDKFYDITYVKNKNNSYTVISTVEREDYKYPLLDHMHTIKRIKSIITLPDKYELIFYDRPEKMNFYTLSNFGLKKGQLYELDYVNYKNNSYLISNINRYEENDKYNISSSE